MGYFHFAYIEGGKKKQFGILRITFDIQIPFGKAEEGTYYHWKISNVTSWLLAEIRIREKEDGKHTKVPHGKDFYR